MNKKGFTFIEILVVIVILGILAATGGLLMSKMYQRNAVGVDAKVTISNLCDGEIEYMLENDDLWPAESYIILAKGDPTNRAEVKSALLLNVPVTTKYDITITRTSPDYVTITAFGANYTVVGIVDINGEIRIEKF